MDKKKSLNLSNVNIFKTELLQNIKGHLQRNDKLLEIEGNCPLETELFIHMIIYFQNIKQIEGNKFKGLDQEPNRSRKDIKNIFIEYIKENPNDYDVMKLFQDLSEFILTAKLDKDSKCKTFEQILITLNNLFDLIHKDFLTLGRVSGMFESLSLISRYDFRNKVIDLRNKIIDFRIKILDKVYFNKKRLRGYINSELGVDYYLNGKIELSLKHSSFAIQIYPECSNSYLTRGSCYQKMKLLRLAEKDFKIFLCKKPGHFKALNNLAYTYLNLGKQSDTIKTKSEKFNMALKVYDDIIKQKPNYIKALLNRGLLQEEIAECEPLPEIGLDNALKDYNKIISITSLNPVVINNIRQGSLLLTNAKANRVRVIRNIKIAEENTRRLFRKNNTKKSPNKKRKRNDNNKDGFESNNKKRKTNNNKNNNNTNNISL